MVEKAFDLARLGTKIAHPKVLRSPEEVLTVTVKALRRVHVPFLIHGAWALAAYGHPRATDDFDFLIVLDDRTVRGLGRAMANLGAFAVEPASRRHLAYSAHGWRLDFFLEPPRSFAGLQRRSVRRRFLAMILPVISRRDLIKRKLARGTLQDRADVEVLQKP